MHGRRTEDGLGRSEDPRVGTTLPEEKGPGSRLDEVMHLINQVMRTTLEMPSKNTELL